MKKGLFSLLLGIGIFFTHVLIGMDSQKEMNKELFKSVLVATSKCATYIVKSEFSRHTKIFIDKSLKNICDLCNNAYGLIIDTGSVYQFKMHKKSQVSKRSEYTKKRKINEINLEFYQEEENQETTILQEKKVRFNDKDNRLRPFVLDPQEDKDKLQRITAIYRNKNREKFIYPLELIIEKTDDILNNQEDWNDTTTIVTILDDILYNCKKASKAWKKLFDELSSYKQNNQNNSLDRSKKIFSQLIKTHSSEQVLQKFIEKYESKSA